MPPAAAARRMVSQRGAEERVSGEVGRGDMRKSSEREFKREIDPKV